MNIDSSILPTLRTPRSSSSRRVSGWAMVARCATALLGGYVAAAGLATLIGRLLPLARVEATAWVMLLSFPIYAGLALWAFAQVSLIRVIAVIWGSAAISIGLVLLIGVRP